MPVDNVPWWKKFLEAMTTVKQAPTTGATPPYQGQTPGGTVAPQQQGGGSASWLIPAIGAGAGITSSVLQGRAEGQQNDRLQGQADFQNELASQEQQKRQFFAEILLPQIMHGMRSTPGNAQAMMQQFRGMRPKTYPGAAPPQAPPAAPGNSGLLQAGARPRVDPFDPSLMQDDPEWWLT